MATAAVTRTIEEEVNLDLENLLDHGSSSKAPLKSMLINSKISYDYSALRALVKRHHTDARQLFGTDDIEQSTDLVTFDRPELIITQKDVGAKYISCAYLKHRVTYAAILEFLKLNRHLVNDEYALRDQEDRMKEPTDFEELKAEKYLRKLEGKFDADIIEFDDEKNSSELMFSVVLNRSEKRIVIVFRGTSSLRDGLMDIKSMYAMSADVKQALGHKVGTHRGFSNYLFNDKWSEEDGSKYDKIINIIKELRLKGDEASRDEYKDYQIFITGHSLGGSLAQLLSLAIAKSSLVKDAEVPTPVTTVTFASPMAGNKEFLKEYQEQEKAGTLRHLRVSNSGDYIPTQMSFPFTFPFMGYCQTGVNIHVYENEKADVGYRSQRSYISTAEYNRPLAMHSLVTYKKRLLKKINAEIFEKSVEDFYKEHAGDCSE